MQVRCSTSTLVHSKDYVTNKWVESPNDECVGSILSSANKGVGYAVPSPGTPFVSTNAVLVRGSPPCEDPMSCSPLCLGRYPAAQS